jgi:hypothetical protein
MELLDELYRKHPLVAAGVLVATVSVLRSSFRRIRDPPLPPGPRGLPLIGSVLDIPTEHPWETYREWSKKYGLHLVLNRSISPIDQVSLGDVIYFEALGNKFLVLNSLDAINTLLVERSANYSDRIQSPIIQL